jgi:ribosome-binding ATPase YchF (GTP1/OBG family)
MPLEAGVVGLPGAGKTSVFNAVTRAHGVPGRENVGMAAIPDDRLEAVANAAGSPSTTPAALKVVDPPGFGAAVLGNLRQVDALLVVVDGFSPGSDPERDLETLRLELVVADTEHAERRLERVRTQAKSGERALREQVAQLERLLAHLEAGRGLAEWPPPLPSGLEPLTTKPLVPLVNGPAGIDAKLEAELAELPEEEAAAFREGASALDEVVRRLFDALDLVTFFTANENEARAWTLRRGGSALDAAGSVHSDLARGFIRCEVIRWQDLVESGSRAEAARRGLQRLEGKEYAVQDGEVLNVRFSAGRG